MTTINAELDLQEADARNQSEDDYYRSLSEVEALFSPFLHVLEGGGEDLRWAVYSKNRVMHVIESIRDLNLIRVTIDPKYLPAQDEYNLGPTGWKIEVIHRGGIFAYILPAVRENERVITNPC